MSNTTGTSQNLPARPDKTIDWLSKSRDRWKRKTVVTKMALKVAKQARKRTQEVRTKLKAHAEQLEAENAQNVIDLQKKDKEIAKLLTTVGQLSQENEELKKKYLSRLRGQG